MPNPATVADVIARWRPLTPQETTNAKAYLADAWWLLTARRPTLEADMQSNAVAEGNVTRVVAAAVLRVLKNPDGLASEQVDDYKFTRSELVSSGLLYFGDDELAALTPASQRGSRSMRLVAYGEY